MQWFLLLHKKELYICFTIMIILAIGSFFTECLYYFKLDYSELHSSDMLFYLRAYNYTYHGIMITLYPLLVVIPFADSYLIDEHFNIIPIIKTRTKIEHYYLSKMLFVFVSAFIILLIPQLLNVLLNAITFPASVIGDFTNGQYGRNYVYALAEFAYPKLFDSHPNLYNLLFICIFAIVGSLIATIVYCFSFYFRKSRLFIICLYFLVSHTVMLINLWANLPIDIDINTYLFACNASLKKSDEFFIAYIIGCVLLITILSRATILRFRKQII